MFDVRCSYDDRVHVDVVWLGKRIRNELFREADADFQSVRPGLFEDPVVISLAAAEPSAVVVEGESGADEGVDRGGWDFREGGEGFEDGEISGKEIGGGILDLMEFQVVSFDDAGVCPADFGVMGDEIREVDFSGKR